MQTAYLTEKPDGLRGSWPLTGTCEQLGSSSCLAWTVGSEQPPQGRFCTRDFLNWAYCSSFEISFGEGNGEGKTGLRILFKKIFSPQKLWKGFLTPGSNSHNLLPATTWLCPSPGSRLFLLLILQRRVPAAAGGRFCLGRKTVLPRKQRTK